jgi:hypothetical protein
MHTALRTPLWFSELAADTPGTKHSATATAANRRFIEPLLSPVATGQVVPSTCVHCGMAWGRVRPPLGRKRGPIVLHRLGGLNRGAWRVLQVPLALQQA